MFGDQVDYNNYLLRLSQMTEPARLFTLNLSGEVVPHFEVTADVVRILLIDEATLRIEVDKIAGEVMHWGRISARQQRCAAVANRKFRQWKAQQELALRKAVEDGSVKGWGQAGRASTEQAQTAYRTAPEYEVHSRLVEEVQEACLVADAIHHAFKLKKDMLRMDVLRASDGSLQRLSP